MIGGAAADWPLAAFAQQTTLAGSTGAPN